MFGFRDWNSLVSCVVTTVCISSALVALCLAKDVQMPLNLYTDASLQWKHCGEVNNHTLQCSRLDVPKDHFSHSSDKTFSIPIIRMLAKNASATGDRHIFLNPGGPGASGVGFLRGSAFDLNKLIGEGFHLLSFDPRGVCGSIPKAVCYSSNSERAAAFASNLWDLKCQAGAMYTRAENKAKACEDMMGEYGKYISTPQIAADMNSILDAIGQQKMYYWGLSYGTTLGQTYAQMFPERVSRMVLDGVSNLDEWYNSFLIEESLIDTDKIFTGFIEECFKAGEVCPLRSIKGEQFKLASRLQSYIDGFLHELEEEPIPVYLNSTNYGAITRRTLVTNGIFFALYKPTTWPSFAKILAELLNGNTTPAYNAYSESWVLKYLVDESTTFIGLNDNRKTGENAPVHGIKPVYHHISSRPEMSYLVLRCGIDAEYYPSARGSAVSTLSVEEEDLLSSLHALATKDVFLVRSQV
ncbi:hypothetical protein CAN33_0023865 [Aspergillus niger]|uniref:AB hydrolase-1 domain-containing protein n=1 Tax=Aspergillus niger TaxID=5061 RepID=A0A505I0A6_ASPNG|nr:hypothetical protein CAN33_0023865 [Aspergillus niger]